MDNERETKEYDEERGRFFEEIIEDLLNGDANRALRRLEALGYRLEDLPV